MKKCSKCGELKPKTEFYKNKNNKDGLYGSCKKCRNKITKKYRENNPEKIKENSKEYYKNNPEKIKERARMWRKNNPEKDRKSQRKYYKNNIEKFREYNKKYREDNLEKIKKWTKNNAEYFREYWAKRRSVPQNKVNASIRENIRQSLKGNKNGRKWETLVGYTLEELMAHLESKFEPWMNWENYGSYEKGKLKWHIDHIRPISLFNFISPEEPEFKKCWGLNNLQPLEAKENIKKGNKY